MSHTDTEAEAVIIIESDVRCTDGAVGRLRRLIVDVTGRKLTHLAVKANDLESGRLVPADQVASGGADVLLRCSLAEFEDFEGTEEMLLPPDAPEQESWPFTAHDVGGRFPADFETFERDSAWANITPTLDRIPGGGLEILHGEPAYATDGEAGRTRGLIIDLRDQQVTHVVLGKGHLWARTRIAVPIASVTNVADGIRLDLSKDQLHDLPDILAGEDTQEQGS